MRRIRGSRCRECGALATNHGPVSETGSSGDPRPHPLERSSAGAAV